MNLRETKAHTNCTMSHLESSPRINTPAVFDPRTQLSDCVTYHAAIMKTEPKGTKNCGRWLITPWINEATDIYPHKEANNDGSGHQFRAACFDLQVRSLTIQAWEMQLAGKKAALLSIQTCLIKSLRSVAHCAQHLAAGWAWLFQMLNALPVKTGLYCGDWRGGEI